MTFSFMLIVEPLSPVTLFDGLLNRKMCCVLQTFAIEVNLHINDVAALLV